MITLDFWTRQSAEETLARCLSTKVTLILYPLDHSDGNFSRFQNDVDKLIGMGLAKPATGPIFLKCKHLTASMDKCQGIRENGLIPLRKLLETNSDLRHFLLDEGITVDFDSITLNYSNRNQVISFSKEDLTISDSADIKMLSRRFSNDDGITAFLAEESISSYYADLAYAPELLSTIEKALYLPDGELTNSWRNKTSPFLISICAPLNECDNETFQEGLLGSSANNASRNLIDPIETAFNFIFQQRANQYAYFQSNSVIEAKRIDRIEPFHQE